MKPIFLIKESHRPYNIRKLLERAKAYRVFERHTRYFIKVNLIGYREKYAMTDAEATAELVRFIKESNSKAEILVGDASEVALKEGKSTSEVFKRQKFAYVKKEGAELVPLEEFPYEREAEVETLEGTRKVRICSLQYDFLISFTPPKTHNLIMVSATLDNVAFGMVHPEDRVFLYGGKQDFSEEEIPRLSKLAHKNVARVASVIRPDYSIIDGLWGMEGKGPIHGSPVFHQFAICSFDPVGVDALVVHLMGFDVSGVGYLKFAEERGLGVIKFRGRVRGEDPDQLKFPYRCHPNAELQLKWKEV